jgi:predicted dehydrogenase
MNRSKQTLNVAMIGHGFIAKAHSNAFRQVNHFFDTPFELDLKVICGRDRDSTQVMANTWGWEEVAVDWHEVVGRSDIDVVDVATPNVLHAPISIAAAKAGKMVWCEKPLAMTLAEAREMTSAMGNTPNLVWFNYRRVPAVAFAKRLLDEGKLGDIYHYRAVYLNQSGNNPLKTSGWRYRRAQAGSGASGDLLSHSLDTALYLNGPIQEFLSATHTFAPQRDVDDAVAMLVRFANGSVGTFEATRYGVGCRNRNSFEINGSKGMLRFDLEHMNRLEFLDATEPAHLQAMRSIMVTGPNHPYWENFWKPGHEVGYEHTFIATLGDFLKALAGKQEFHPNFADGLQVQSILDAVESSSNNTPWTVLRS